MTQPHTHQSGLAGYLITYAILVVLATVSLLTSGLPDAVALALALVIAVVKAVLVLMRFMNLREETFSFHYVMLVSVLLVTVLVALTTIDPLTRAPFPPSPGGNPSFGQARLN